MTTYGAGSVAIATPTGAELVTVDNGGSVKVTLTSQQIASLAGTGSSSVNTALNTVGAGTITAAGIVGKFTTRGGSQTNTAFTDTTATGAQIEAALGGTPTVGQSWSYEYYNNTNANASIQQGATGVTLTTTTVFAGSTATFLVTRTAASTYTIVLVAQTGSSALGSAGTFTLNGTTAVTVADTRVTANSAIVMTLKTVGGTVGAAPAIKTITAATGFTVAGTASDVSVFNYLILG